MYLFVKYILPTVEPTIKHNVLFVFKPQILPKKSARFSEGLFFIKYLIF